MKTRNNPTETQANIVLDFTVGATKFYDTKFLFDADGLTIYAVCEDGYIKITESSSQAIEFDGSPCV